MNIIYSQNKSDSYQLVQKYIIFEINSINSEVQNLGLNLIHLLK